MLDELELIGQHAEALVCAHRRLAEEGLVVCSQGNASVFIPELDVILIKASGAECATIRNSDIVAMRLDGDVMVRTDSYVPHKNPSTDFEAHRLIYQRLGREEDPVRAIVHTHSRCATAFAVQRIGIPCVLTSMADEFGGPVPLLPYTTIGTDEMGTAVCQYRLHDRTGARQRSSAMLLEAHGVVTVGATLAAAVKSAIMVEDCAGTILTSRIFPGAGGWQTLPQKEIDRAHTRYKTSYGQRGD